MSNDNRIITLPYKFIPRSYQLDFYQAVDSGQFSKFFLRWCRRSGKDKSCAALAAKIMMQRVGNAFYLYPSYSQGRKAFWEGKDKEGMKFLDHFPPEIRQKGPTNGLNNNEMKIELINGSSLRVMGTENIDSLVGTNPILIIFSEWALQVQAAYDFLKPILEENGGIVIFNSTPRGQNHMYKMEVHNKGKLDWYFSEVQTLWPDRPNYFPILLPEQIQRIREDGTDEELIEQEYGVSYVAGEQGRYYASNINAAQTQGRIGKFEHDCNKYVDVIMDLGYRDDTSVGFLQTDGNRRIWVDYYEANTKELSHYVRMLKDKGYSYRYIVLPHDAEGGKLQIGLSHREVMEKLLEDAGIHCTVEIAPKVAHSQEKIQAVRQIFPNYFFNLETTRDLVSKLSLYHRSYNKAQQKWSDLPAHDINSHAADMVAYDALTLDRNSFQEYGERIQVITEWNPLDYEG